MLTIKNIKVSYGKAMALENVSLHVEEGQLVALLGSNGAGKSTLLNTISGILPPQAGSITFEGVELTKLASHQIVERGVVQVPEGREVFPQLSVKDNLRMGAYTRRDPAGIEKDLHFVFDLFPRLKERQSQMAGSMSGGEAQMVAIARALLSRPKLLMLDEPSLGLAPVVRSTIYDVVRQIHEERGVTILLVEQNARWALAVADHGYILENGRVSIEDSGDNLAKNEHVQRAYLGY